MGAASTTVRNSPGTNCSDPGRTAPPVGRERKERCAHSVSPGSYLIEPREPQVPSWGGNEEKRDPVQLEHLARHAWMIVWSSIDRVLRGLSRRAQCLPLEELCNCIMIRVCAPRRDGLIIVAIA
jgi:hypothetical protein